MTEIYNPNNTNNTDTPGEDMGKPTNTAELQTPEKASNKFEHYFVLQSPRVVFSDIASPRPRQEEDQNDSFQLPLAIEQDRAAATERRKQVLLVLLSIILLLGFFMSMIYTNMVDKYSFIFVIGTVVTLILVVLLRLAWRWMRIEKKYHKLDTLSMA